MFCPACNTAHVIDRPFSTEDCAPLSERGRLLPALVVGILLLGASFAFAGPKPDRCLVPGHGTWPETAVTPEMHQIGVDMNIALRTPYGRDGKPGVPLGPMYLVKDDGTFTVNPVAKAGPKRVVDEFGHSNPTWTINALIKLLVTNAIPGLPKIQPDVYFVPLGASKHGVTGYLDPVGPYWQDAMQSWRNAKVGPANQVLGVTQLPEVKGVILGLTGPPDTGIHMTAAQVMQVVANSWAIHPQAAVTFLDMANLTWAIGDLTNEGSAHNDYDVFRGIVAPRTEGRYLAHYANHVQAVNCRTDYYTDWIHPSKPVGAEKMATALAWWMFEDPTWHAILFEPAVVP